LNTGAKVLLWLIFWSALLGLGAWLQYTRFLNTPLDIPSGGIVFEVRPGDGLRSVARKLSQGRVTHDGWNWRLLARLDRATIQAGEYRLETGLTPAALVSQLSTGMVMQHSFTIVEGWTYRQLRNALLATEALSTDEELLEPDRVMTELGVEGALATGDHPEGWFLPETYAFTRGTTGIELLSRAHSAMQSALADAWAARLPGAPLDDPYQLLTLASIVEKESAMDAERPDIAGVFTRRLMQGWRLETDPTVIYGLGENFDGDIRRRDLRTDNPYNTYTRHGLPPTPIAMPGLSALLASAVPAPGTAMFFVADGTGGHVFSDTLDDHNRAVQALLARGQD
jgi:UPF0755 protein